MWARNRPAGSILATAIHGAFYPIELRIQGMLVDLLRAANWQRGRGGPKPKPMRWPWAVRDISESFGKAAPLEEIRDYLMMRNGRAPGK